MGVKFRLGLMMFLQYAIWGAWAPPLSEYLQNTLGFNGTQVGIIYSLLPLATIISPFIGGQVADRYFATQNVIAFLQFIGGIFLIILSRISNYTPMMWMMLVYSLLYAPTLALTNSLAFHHLSQSDKEFGWIRVWGTIGWIIAGLILSGWRYLAKANTTFAFQGDTLLLAGIFSIIMGIFSLKLPHTPPKKEGSNPLAFVEAIKMLKDKNFLVFIIISFVVATELMFYYVLTAPFLTSEKIGVASQSVAGVMVIAQIAEIFVMAFALPYFLPKFGIRTTLTIGVIAWPIRYIIFAIGSPVWLVIASLALHGLCYVFFFTASQIYVDMVAPKDIRASAQSLIALVTLGIGMYIGSIFAGWIQNHFSVIGAQGNIVSTNWTGVFLVPCVLTILCAVAFMVLFKEKRTYVTAEA
ncbi:MFS transporter [candidate division KSB1 bacterium]|nr:MAG: MFS transporter [candidate division KSB1 bacterium]